ncbi:HutD family protein [Massilia terrae]|uniref:HutD family protein n=1 Tax=Massilia terrae TaxID=1811224 RepID=A0ABT2D2M6_9BURK|nr:HutD family protein [Massilia terrae]MCS0660364.1 HutD family protein [Massilia terrae]
MTTLIPFAGLAPVSWKNGGGSTTEIAIAPLDAGFDEFEWRVSLATIAADGAFSQFPGVDRTLVLVDGHGATLDIDDDEQVTVSADEPVQRFAGESRVQAKLHRGATTDFNVMTRRDICHHEFGRRRLEGVSKFATRADVTVLFLASGDALTVSNDAERIGMVRFDAVVFDSQSLWTLDAAQGEVFIVDIYYE